jgi:hypothetical protein
MRNRNPEVAEAAVIEDFYRGSNDPAIVWVILQKSPATFEQLFREAGVYILTKPPKVLGPPTVVLVLRTLDNPVDAHNHLTSSIIVSSSFCPRALHPSRRYYISSKERISGSKLQ